MIVRSTTLAGKGVVFGASAAAHAAFFLAAHGAPSPPAAGSSRTTSAEIQIEPMREVEAPEEILSNQVGAVPPHSHTHTHPYPVPSDHDLVPHDPSLEHAHAPSSPHALAAGAGVVVTADALPRFTMTIAPGGAAEGTSLGSPSASVGAHPAANVDDDAPVAAAAVDTPARRVRGADPEYPPEARRDGIEADVQLVLIVSRAGAVESVQVARRAGHGLDEAALAAARGFQFTTAMKNGHAVRVRLPWTFTFRLE